MTTQRPSTGDRTVVIDDPTAAPGPDPGTRPEVAADRRSGWRRAAAVLATTLACLLVLVALVGPNQPGQLTPAALLRIPLEALVAAAVLLVLPARPRRVVAIVAGVLLGLLMILKVFDIGFFAVLGRQFDPVIDWILVAFAVEFLTSSLGTVGAIVAVVVAAVLAVAVVVLLTRSVLRLTRIAVSHRRAAARAVTVLAAVWVTCALVGAQLVPGVPVASADAARLGYDRALQVRDGVADRQLFAEQAAVDAFRDTPGAELLTALRGKDVVFAFVESYGRSAIEDPGLAPQIGALLDDGTRRLGAAGFSSRSGFLTSPVTGGGSWLAHATLLSGLWVNNPQRYNTLVASDRLTLTSAFRRASWETVAVMPGTTRDWPEGEFYGYDRVYDSRSLGYHGPAFNWVKMPDQYTLSAFERLEHERPERGPMMADLTLVSSHAPWAPIPELVGWDAIGDGSVFAPMAGNGEPPEVVWTRNRDTVRADYQRSIQYTLGSLISYVQTYGDDDLVLVILGDHQPSVVPDNGAERDVPITIVTRDTAVMDRIAGWGWQDGLKPGPQAPVWPMDAFRDRFLCSFTYDPGHGSCS